MLDFSKLLPGPYATQVLADMGMSVTRVTLPHSGDLMKETLPAAWRRVNRGKEEASFDFRTASGRKRIESMIEKADVLVEGFRPGRMEKMGLGYDDARRLNPKIVYCSITGYPRRGIWGRKAGHDINFLAVSGWLGIRPTVPPSQPADLAGAMEAAARVLAALLERERTGKGALVEVSLAEAAFSWLPVPLGELEDKGRHPHADHFWWGGQVHPFYRLYGTKDGGLLAVGALETGFAVSLLDALGLSALRDLAGDPYANAAALTEALSQAFLSADRKEWERRLEGKELCVTPVLSLEEAQGFMELAKNPKRLPARRPRP